MLEIIFLFLLSGYFLQSILFIIGAKKKFTKTNSDEFPAATLIVAARDEEKNILDCLKSLDQLIYPDDKLEILIVDDCSTDSTAEIIDKFISGKKKFRMIVIDEEKQSNLQGKTRAVATAIDQASGEIILTTDADCIVNPKWVKTIASYYNSEVGVVNGYTSQVARNLFSGIQAIDFIYLLIVAAGTINIKRPISCIGNNMSFRKKAYLDTGGFERLPFSVTEDFMLLMGIKKLKKYELIYPLDKESLVTSKPCPTMKDLFNQKKRWAVGGLKVPPGGFSIMFWGFFTNLCVLLTPVFFSPSWLYLVLFKISIDFFVLYPVHRILGITKNLKYFPLYQIYYLIYVIMLPFILLLNRKVKWKGRVY